MLLRLAQSLVIQLPQSCSTSAEAVRSCGVPMKQVSRADAIPKTEFHRRLREWLAADEAQIGPEEVDGRTSWVHVRDGSRIFGLHADTKRDAVNQYLQTVTLHGDDLSW